MPFCPTPCQMARMPEGITMTTDGGPGPGMPCPICNSNPCVKSPITVGTPIFDLMDDRDEPMSFIDLLIEDFNESNRELLSANNKTKI